MGFGERKKQGEPEHTGKRKGSRERRKEKREAILVFSLHVLPLARK
jgi:hypothetical protein